MRVELSFADLKNGRDNQPEAAVGTLERMSGRVMEMLSEHQPSHMHQGCIA
jgi:hypothetical protein